jgi:hypothetical protein
MGLNAYFAYTVGKSTLLTDAIDDGCFEADQKQLDSTVLVLSPSASP